MSACGFDLFLQRHRRAKPLFSGASGLRMLSVSNAWVRVRVLGTGDETVVLFVGRVNREKGVDLLLAAFDRVLAAEPRARLVLVGAVYERRWLRRMIRSDRVIITGQQPPEVVAAAYQRADVFAFPSGTDTQALVLQEAALAGVPSVLIDPVLFERGALGGAAVLATKETFADAIVGLLRDPAGAKALGARAAHNAARHTPQAFAAAMLGIYTRLTTRARTAPVVDATMAG